MNLKRSFLTIALSTLGTSMAFGQAAAAPAKLYTGSFGGGLAITGGNTDTKNFNLAFALVRDPKTKNVMKSSVSYLRGSQSKVTNLDRSTVNLRDEYTVSGRTFVFGQVDHLRDHFKGIIFQWGPSGGVGYKLVNSDATKLEIDGGAGGIFERNPGKALDKSGSLIAGQSLRQNISSTAAFTQSFSTVWKTRDFSDYNTNFSVGLTTSVAKRLEVKFEFVDTYKHLAVTGKKNNDTAFVTTFLVKL